MIKEDKLNEQIWVMQKDGSEKRNTRKKVTGKKTRHLQILPRRHEMASEKRRGKVANV
jgi:hypothetical protein